MAGLMIIAVLGTLFVAIGAPLVLFYLMLETCSARVAQTPVRPFAREADDLAPPSRPAFAAG